MAQVRKYQRGGQTPEKKPRIFKWAGVGDYNVDDIQSTYAREVNNYINSLDLSDEERAKVRDESYRILQATMNGTINSRDASGAWAVPTGYESTGINEKERKGFLGIKGKDYVRDNDFYRNLGYGVMDKVLRNTALYTPTTVASKKSTFDTNFENYLSKYYFKDLPFNKDYWDYNNARVNIGARLTDWRKEVEASDLDDDTKTDLLARIDAGLAGLQSETIDDDYTALARLGFNARQWIDKDYVSSTNAEQPLTEEQKKQQETAKDYQDYLKANRDSGDSYYFSQQLLRPNFDLTNYKGLLDYSTKNPVNWAEWTTTSDPQSFSNSFWAFFDQDRIKDLENQGFYENGYYYIPQSVNETEGSIFRFNRNTNNIEKVPLSTFKKGVEKLEYLFGISAGIRKPWEYKEGGIIKAQQGWYIDNSANLRAKRLEESNTKDKATKQQETQQTKQSTGFEYSNDPFEWNKETILRASSLATDLASLGLSYSGVGSIGSAVTGVGATALNQAADQAAGKSFLEALGDNALSYGLDIVSVIPFAKSAKIPKILSNAAKLAPVIITGLGVYNGGEEYLKSWDKVKNGESLNMQDYRNMLESIQLLVSGKAASRNIKKLDRDLQASISGTHQRIRTNQGFKELTNEQISEIKNAASYEDANKILQKYIPGASLPKEYKAWGLGKETGKATIETRNAYQPKSYTRTTLSGMDYTENPTWWAKTMATKSWNNPLWGLNEKTRRGIDWAIHPQMSWRRHKGNKPESNVEASNTSNATKTAHLWENTPSRLALMERNPIVTPYSTNNNKRGFREDKTDHNKFHDQRNPQFDYSEPTITSRFKTAVSTENTIGYTPTTRNIPTVSWETVKKNYDVVQNLKDKRNLNEQNAKITNAENKELNRAIDAENKARERARKETAYNAWWQEVLANMERKYPKRVTPNLTEEQIKAKQNYVNWWLETLSNQARTLPKKQSKSSNTKKKSKESKGYVNRHQAGGIIKAQQGTTLRDVASTANWANQIYGTDAYFNWLKSFNINNYQDFNNYQKGWNTNYLASNYNPTGTNKTGNIAYSKNVWNSQGIFNKQANGVNQIIESLANNGTITRRGNSGDNAARNFQDGYFGGQEYLRHGGMESMLTPEQVTEINKNVNPQGLEYYFDPTTKMGFLRPMQQAAKTATIDPLAGLPKEDPETPELQGNTSQEVLNELIGNNKTARGAWIDPKTKTSKQINWDNILGTARLAGTIWTNNRIAKGLRESLSPLLLDPVQLRRQVTGDLVTRNYMEKLGAEANRIGARPITSDASLQLGQQLDFNNRANEYRIKGYLADKQAIDKTTAEAQKVTDFNKEQRVDVANRNRAAMLGIRQAKANIEAQRKSANWAQAVAPWLMDKEMRFRENQKLNQLLDYQENQYLYGDQYEQAAKAAQSALDQAKANYLSIEGNNETGWLTSPEYKAASDIYQSSIESAAKKYRDNILSSRKRIYNYNPFLFTYKSGGRLSYKEKSLLQRADAINKSFMNDRKLFHKMITDSQKENNKLIMSLGGLTKELIIKSMTYGG